MRLKQSDAPPILTPEKKYQLEEEVKDDIPRGPPLKLSNDSIQGPNPGSDVQGISIPNQSIIQSNNNNNDFNSRAGPSIQQTNIISNKCQSLTLNAVTSNGDGGSHMPVNAIDHNVSTDMVKFWFWFVDTG